MPPPCCRRLRRLLDTVIWASAPDTALVGSTPGPALATSPSGCTARASICNSPSTTTAVGARRSTRLGWSTRPPARPAPRGSARCGGRHSGRRGKHWRRRGRRRMVDWSRFEFLPERGRYWRSLVRDEKLRAGFRALSWAFLGIAIMLIIAIIAQEWPKGAVV